MARIQSVTDAEVDSSGDSLRWYTMVIIRWSGIKLCVNEEYATRSVDMSQDTVSMEHMIYKYI